MGKLDVRPLMAAGGDPFTEIMEAVQALGPEDELELIAPLDPVPLYQVLGAQGFEHRTLSLGDGDYQVIFYRPGP